MVEILKISFVKKLQVKICECGVPTMPKFSISYHSDMLINTISKVEYWLPGSFCWYSKYFYFSGFFIHGFPKLIRFQTHHDKVLKKFLPKLKKHFDKQGVDSGIYTLKWFFQCFLDRVSQHLYLQTCINISTKACYTGFVITRLKIRAMS